MKHFLSFIFIIACAIPSVAQQTHTITMNDTDFLPATLTIKQGDMVVWKNTSSMPHTATSGSNCTSDGMWDSGDMAVGDSFAYTFTSMGNFDYYCEYHCGTGMTGVIVVESGTGIKEGAINPANFSLYPNPAENTIFISATSPAASRISIWISDVTGKRISVPERKTLLPGKNNLQLNIETLPPGMYILRLSADAQVYTKPFYKL